jgi:hypothetical protein
MRKEDVSPHRSRKGEEAAQCTKDHGVELDSDGAMVVASNLGRSVSWEMAVAWP